MRCFRIPRICFLPDFLEKIILAALLYFFSKFLERDARFRDAVSEIKFNLLKINVMKSVNTFSLTGRLTADARYFESKNGKIARFSIAHNFGRNVPALFIDCVIFPKKDEILQEDLLKKGTPVLVSGYLRPNNTAKDGKTYNATDFVVTSLSPAEVEDEGE